MVASLGSTGSLVAAVAVAGATVAGSVAFSAWPGDPGHDDDGHAEVRLAEVPGRTTGLGSEVVLSVSGALAPDDRSPTGATTLAGGAAAPPATARTGAGTATPPRGGPGARTPEPGAGAASPRTPESSQQAATDQASTDAASRRPSLDDVASATQDAGKALGSGLDLGAEDLAADIQDKAPNTSKLVERTGDVTGAAVQEAAKAVAEVLRVLPLGGDEPKGAGPAAPAAPAAP
ncbi:hypothetical protein [Conexibacter sp. SYSU D00693]|uniref:hypothetical protein n=1 Tax=Conexibacter sp. SYSU D00693 TaxID=2812560 RepID=UPI00196BA795|nr:hypothetical protein [Conexibacter sp. SYSU D00693]